MKQISALFLFLLFALVLSAQDKPLKPNSTLKWAPSGMFIGSLSFQGEYNFGRNSLTARIGVPVSAHHTLKWDGKDADFDMKAMTFLAGYRHYLSKKHMKGVYFEPYFKYVHHTSEGVGTAILTGETVKMNFTNDYNGAGIGAQLGYQFLIIKKIVIDVYFLGPEINSSRNNFKAIEVTHTVPWTYAQANQAEYDIREFIDQFPFVRNHVNLQVDQVNKTVRADFKGALPGFRAGVSFGFAF